MDPIVVKAKLIKVLETIQCDSGFAPAPIIGTTYPLKDLEGFDTSISPTAMDFLAQALGVDIPLDMNIFVSFDGRRALSIDEIVAGVGALVPVTR